MLAVQAAIKKTCGILMEDKIKQLLSFSIDQSIEKQSDDCVQCSKFQNFKDTLDELDYEELVDFIFRFSK